MYEGFLAMCFTPGGYGKRARRVNTRCSTSEKHARACAVMRCVYSIPVRYLCPTCAPTRCRTAFPVFHNPSPRIALQVGATSEPARLTPLWVPTSHHWLSSTSEPARPTPPLVPLSYHWLSATSESARPTLAGGRAIQGSRGPLLNAPRLSSTAAVVVRSRWPSVFAYGSHKFFGNETRKRARERERSPKLVIWIRLFCIDSKGAKEIIFGQDFGGARKASNSGGDFCCNGGSCAKGGF
jgi:hypothetical protein